MGPPRALCAAVRIPALIVIAHMDRAVMVTPFRAFALIEFVADVDSIHAVPIVVPEP